jgi:hypothetical protein
MRHPNNLLKFRKIVQIVRAPHFFFEMLLKQRPLNSEHLGTIMVAY